MSNIRKFLINPIENHFGKALPPGVVGKLADEFEDSLSSETLASVAEEITGRLQKLPVQNAIRLALLSAQRKQSTLARAPVRGSDEPMPWDDVGKEAAYARRSDQAKALVRGNLELARQADREGWLLALFDFCQDRERLPERTTEIESCKAKARRTEDALMRLRDTSIVSRKAGPGVTPDNWREISAPNYDAMMRLRQAVLNRAATDIFGHDGQGAV